MRHLIAIIAIIITFAPSAYAQDLKIATVTRPPFSMQEDGRETGFSLDLWAALAEDLGRPYKIIRVDTFAEMLRLTATGEVDAAIANISITASRESVMDFSQPIFESGLQVLVPSGNNDGISVLKVIFSADLLLAILLAFAMIFGGGLIMWRFERNAQPFFNLPVKKAMFPAFWWALNLIVNGGFEERMPRTAPGRVFGVFLVLSSLFLVSIFVAKITAVLTVDAIQSSVNSVSDLYGKRVGTITGSTAADYLDNRELRFTGFVNLDDMLAEFEARDLDAIVFDAPVLAFYANQSGGKAEMAGSIFLRENYGIALRSNSPLAEGINQSLLGLREDGTYERIYRKWFGMETGG